MPPKKAQKNKMSLNEFLGDSALGSWADEMDQLPSAPAVRTDEERQNDRYGRRDDFLSSRPDRVAGPPREDLPLPTQPPYTAFVGNLAFDLTENELGEFFGGSSKTKSVKIIKDRDEKPKGFGYIEFTDLESLKEGLAKSGSNFSSRTIRVSVAEPPKERGGFSGGFEDDSKFDSPWRRDGPLPDLPDQRDSSRRRFDGPSAGDRAPAVSEGASDWRSSRPRGPAPEPEGMLKRKGSGFTTPDSQPGAADREDVWKIGSKFKPASTADESPGSRMGSLRGRGDLGPPRESAPQPEESDWRSSGRPRSAARNDNTSPTSSTPPTPQMNRRKLELLPRSNSASASPSPLSSPKFTSPTAGPSASRSSPFGAAKPVDVSSKEKEVTDRLEKEREMAKDRLAQHPMSRNSSKTGVDRNLAGRTRTPPPPSAPSTPSSPRLSSSAVSATLRPSISFANVAGTRKDSVTEQSVNDGVDSATEKVAQVNIQ